MESTLALGEALGRCLNAELTIGLVGPLGAGKTDLVKGIAAGNAPAMIARAAAEPSSIAVLLRLRVLDFDMIESPIFR